VKGRGVSQKDIKGERVVFAKARSSTDSHDMVLNGKRVKTPGVLRREYGVVTTLR